MGTTTSDAINNIASTTGVLFNDFYPIFFYIFGFFIVALVYILIIRAFKYVMKNL